jgi:uncharacterized membrane protein YfcA
MILVANENSSSFFYYYLSPLLFFFFLSLFSIYRAFYLLFKKKISLCVFQRDKKFNKKYLCGVLKKKKKKIESKNPERLFFCKSFDFKKSQLDSKKVFFA